ncbi:MAG: NAD-dependent epimerase/dehydratase family protein [Fibrobacterales bacterium]
MKYNTILVTGGTGFLGSHIIKSLINKGFNVVLLKRSFSNINRLKDVIDKIKYYDIDTINIEIIFEENCIDAIIHSATSYGRKEEPLSSIIQTNEIFPLELLQLAVQNSVKLFINTDSLQSKFVSPYTVTKNHFYDWLHYYSEDIASVNLKIEHMYGPYDDDNKFIMWIIQNFQENKKCINLSSGKQKRDFVFIDDVVSAFCVILENSWEGLNTFEVGTGVSTPLKDFVTLLKESYNTHIDKVSTDLSFGALDDRKNEPKELKANIDKLSAFGWKPENDIHSGLEKLFRYVKESVV